MSEPANRYYVAVGHPNWSLYREYVLDREDDVVELRKNTDPDCPIRVIYGMEMDFQPAVVVETYRLVPTPEKDKDDGQ